MSALASSVAVVDDVKLPAKRQFNPGKIAIRLLSLAICVLIWHWASTARVNLGIVTFQNVPTPVDVFHAAWELLHSSVIVSHLKASISRVITGFLAAALAGIVLGVLIGRYRVFENTLLPPLEVLRPIPAVAWILLAILMFLSSERSLLYITFTGALFPILLNTIHGVEAVDPRLIASARSLGATRTALLFEVVLPAATPGIFTGLTIGMGTAWFCLVTAEMISGQFGIGYYTWMSYTIQNYAEIIVGMLLIGVLGMASSALVRQIGNLLMPWYTLQRKKS